MTVCATKSHDVNYKNTIRHMTLTKIIYWLSIIQYFFYFYAELFILLIYVKLFYY